MPHTVHTLSTQFKKRSIRKKQRINQKIFSQLVKKRLHKSNFFVIIMAEGDIKMNSYQKLRKERDLYKSHMIVYIKNFYKKLDYLSTEEQTREIEKTIAWIEKSIEDETK